MAKQQTSLDFSIENILGSDTPPEEEVEKNIEEGPTETLDFSIENILGSDALTPKVSEPPSVSVPVETAVERPVVEPTVSPREPLAQQIEASRELLKKADDASEKAMREGASFTEAQQIRKQVLEDGGIDTPDFAKAKAAIDPVAAFEMETDFPTLDEREQQKGRAFMGKLVTEPLVGVVNLAEILAEITNQSIDILIPGVQEALDTVSDKSGNILDNIFKELSEKYPVSVENLKSNYEKYRGRGELGYTPEGKIVTVIDDPNVADFGVSQKVEEGDKSILPKDSIENVIADTLPIFIGAVGAGKYVATKLPKVKPREALKYITREAKILASGSLGAIFADVLTRDEDEIIFSQLAKQIPEIQNVIEDHDKGLIDLNEKHNAIERFVFRYLDTVGDIIPKEIIDLAGSIQSNPNDSLLKKRATQVLDSLVGESLFLPVHILFLSAAGGRTVLSKTTETLRKARGKEKAIIDGVTEPVEDTAENVVLRTDVIEEAPDAGLARTLNRGRSDQGADGVIPNRVDDVPTETATRNKTRFEDETIDVPRMRGATIDEAPEAGLERVVGTPEYKQRSIVTDIIGAVNTAGARILKGTGSLPKELGRAYVKLQKARTGRGGYGIQERTEIRLLKKEIKQGLKNRPNWNLEDINTYLRFVPKSFDDARKLPEFSHKSERLARDAYERAINAQDEAAAKLPSKIADRLDALNEIIVRNERRINQELGLTGQDRLGYAFKSDGEIYYTRTFDAVNNPSYLKDIQKAINGSSRATADTVSRVEGARRFFTESIFGDHRTYVSLSRNEKDSIDGIILDAVKNLNKTPESLDFILESFSSAMKGRGFGDKVLKSRKQLGPELLALLKESPDKLASLEKSLLNQNKVIAAIDFLSAVKQFAKQAGDDTFDMGGLFPFLAKRQGRVSPKKSAGSESISALNDLKNIEQQIIGGLGGKARGNLIGDFMASDAFYKALSRGVDIGFLNDIFSNNLLGRILSNVTAYGQATQTIVDHGAWMVNTYGMVQSFVQNAYLWQLIKRPSNLKKAFDTMIAEGRTQNNELLNYLGRLKDENVIDVDLISEGFVKNLQPLGKNPVTGLTRILSKGVGKAQKGFEKLARGYGAIDSYGKILGHMAEMEIAKKTFPFKVMRRYPDFKNLTPSQAKEKYDNFIFERASELVRQKGFNYGEAAPIVRTLSRVPIVGNYSLFPTEVIRTNINQLNNHLLNIAQGAGTTKFMGKRRFNPRQIANGLTGLTWQAGMLIGSVYAVKENNASLKNEDDEPVGVPSENTRALDLLGRNFAGSGRKAHVIAPQEQKDGSVIGKYVSVPLVDANAFIIEPAAKAWSLAKQGKTFTKTEQEALLTSAFDAVVAPYTSPKFIPEAILSIIMNSEYRTGKPLYELNATWLERNYGRLTEIAEALQPDEAKKVREYFKNLNAIELAEALERSKVNAFGFPIDLNDLRTWYVTGIKPTTYDYARAVAADLHKDAKLYKSNEKDFDNFVSRIDPQLPNDKLVQQIKDKFRDSLEKKYKNLSEFADKVHVYSKFKLTDENYKVVEFGFPRIYKALGKYGEFFKEPNDELVETQALIKEGGKGIFIPDQPATREKVIQNFYNKFGKKIPQTLFRELSDIAAEYQGRPLVTQGLE
jgi:hypothetical protein